MNKAILIILIILFILNCSKNPITEENNLLKVFVSIAPLEYFTNKIGGEKITTSVLVSPGKSPAVYEPSPQEVMTLAEADIFFTIGVPFENSLLPKIHQSNMLISDVSKGITKRNMEEHTHSENENSPFSDHKDPHIWLSPVLAEKISENILNTFITEDPENKEYYISNYNSLITELDFLNNELTEMFSDCKEKVFLVFHPSFGYFADQYGLTQIAIETGGKEPEPQELEDIILFAQKNNLSRVFTQPEFSRRSAEVIAEAISGSVVTLSTLNPDYINNLRLISTEILQELED